VWREADQLFWQERGQNAVSGAVELLPQSETAFFTKLDAAHITFRKSANGNVIGVTIQLPGSPEALGTRQ
jgi:hypothetical protein